jgi:lysozyme family protein
MLYNDSNEWVDYVKHVLYYEGGLSNDSKDTASKCVEAGLYHTNKGVTFCTFKSLAPVVGISPVTYERFMKLTDEDSAKFLYKFYESVKGNSFPNDVALLLTEIAWSSGTSRAFSHLKDSLLNLGVKTNNTPEMIEAVKKLGSEKVYIELEKTRKKYLNFLTASPKYAKYKRGWNNRLNSFLQKFNPSTIEGKKKNRDFGDFSFADFIFNLLNPKK